MNKHKHVIAMLLLKIHEALDTLSKHGIGFINYDSFETIIYEIDEVEYVISIKVNTP